jgi:hypothetical protein
VKRAQEGYQALSFILWWKPAKTKKPNAAVDEQIRLQEEIFPDLKVGAGSRSSLKPAEKDAVMLAFEPGRV